MSDQLSSGGRRSTLAIDATIHRLLATNDGAISRRTLTAEGVNRGAIARRIDAGALIELAPGVVGLPHPADIRRQEIRAGLESHRDSVLGYESAAERHGLIITPPSLTHVVVPHGRTRSADHLESKRVVVHQTRSLAAIDRSEADGFPVTSVARTLVDLGVRPRPSWLAWLCQTALKEGLVSIVDLRACVRAHSRQGKAGIVRCREIVDHLVGEETMELSELELRFLRLVAPLAITGLTAQHRPPWYDGRRGIVDFAIAELGIIIELDGRRWHALTQDQVADRGRDRVARASGWVVLRYGWEEVTRRPDDVLDDLTSQIDQRRRTSPAA